MAGPVAAAGPPVLVLTGPTGSGKSAWAEALAESAPVELVSMDSAQVYRGLDIGTAKPSAALRQLIEHHLIDVCDPAETYSAGRFATEALDCIRGIHGRGRVPLIVGGTMLYLRALLHGLAPLPAGSARLRERIDAQAAREGWPALHAQLAQYDPVAAARINTTDAQRIQRALEVWYATGTPISALQQNTVSPLSHATVHAWALIPGDRELLHARLAQRFDAMMRAGFLAEVQSLHRRGDLSARHSSMRAVGYRQLWAHLEGEWPLAAAVERGIIATRQLAKRQLTWIRSETGLMCIDPGQPQALASWLRAARQKIHTGGG